MSNQRKRIAGVILAAAHEVEVLRTMCSLRIDKYRVLAANDGEQALDIFSYLGGDIDLALVDVGLPRMGGRQLISTILAVKPDARVLVVHEHGEQPLPGLEAPQARTITKPFAYHNLLREVRLALSAQRIGSQPAERQAGAKRFAAGG